MISHVNKGLITGVRHGARSLGYGRTLLGNPDGILRGSTFDPIPNTNSNRGAIRDLKTDSDLGICPHTCPNHNKGRN